MAMERSRPRVRKSGARLLRGYSVHVRFVNRPRHELVERRRRMRELLVRARSRRIGDKGFS